MRSGPAWARPFLQHMIALARNVSKQHHHIKLNAGFLQHLNVWKEFISNWNGTNIFLSSTSEDTNTLDLHTDVSGTLGFGGIFWEEMVSRAMGIPSNVRSTRN